MKSWIFGNKRDENKDKRDENKDNENKGPEFFQEGEDTIKLLEELREATNKIPEEREEIEKRRVERTEERVIVWTDGVEGINRWIPNDELQERFYQMDDVVGIMKHNETKIRELKQKLKTYEKQYDELDKKEDKTIFEKYKLVDWKRDIYNLKSQILNHNSKIEDAKNYNPEIFDKWDSYLDEAALFIENNKLEDVMSPSDILNSNGITIKAKEIFDESQYQVRNDNTIKNLVKVDMFFNVRQAASSSNRLKDIERCTITKKEMDKIENEGFFLLNDIVPIAIPVEEDF